MERLGKWDHLVERAPRTACIQCAQERADLFVPQQRAFGMEVVRLLMPCVS